MSRRDAEKMISKGLVFVNQIKSSIVLKQADEIV
ncbi:hypothetical protein [Mycoplasmopsis agalactiae]